jgi:hypothetical protein
MLNYSVEYEDDCERKITTHVEGKFRVSWEVSDDGALQCAPDLMSEAG